LCVLSFSAGVTALTDAISGNGAISSVNVLGNSIGLEQAQELIKILHTKEKLTTLCGFSGDETELNLSKKNLSAGCGMLVANEISDMRALFSVDVGNNHIPADKLQEIDQAVRSNRLRLIREDSNKSLSEIDLSSRYLDAKDAIVVAEYIKDSGALRCTDGTPYQSEKSFMMSTHVCRHCGQHKTQHTNR
jgi:hypothetical protein